MVLRGGRRGPAVVGLGLDGASFGLVERMVGQGELPNLAELASKGSLLRMSSSLPAVSTVAWASLLTGKNPGGFGVFGFEERLPNSYRTYIPDGRNLRSQTVLSVLDGMGRRYVSINVPMTHPPSAKAPSVVVSSLLSPSIEKAASSPQVLSDLRRLGYVLDLELAGVGKDPNRLMKSVREVCAGRERAMLHFMKSRRPDLFLGIFTESDRLSHLAYDDAEDGPVAEVYRMFDATVGKFRKIAPGAEFAAFSDHGFCRAEWELQLNRWLVEEGYLRLDDGSAKKGLEGVLGGSQAYALDSGRIYLNLKDREPLGCIEDGEERDFLTAEIVDGLKRLRSPSGGLAVKRAWKREEMYSGQFSYLGPDIVIEPERGVDAKTGFRASEVFSSPRAAGIHSGGDAILVVDRPIETAEPRIQDCYELLLGPCRTV